MSICEDAKMLVNDKMVQERTKDIISDIIKALLGDPLAVAKIIIEFEHSPLFIRDRIFWIKLQKYINGVYTCQEDYKKLKTKLAEYADSDEGAQRLIECIDRADTSNKIQFLINATNHLLDNEIDCADFFRICRAIAQTLEEDLQFLKNHISEETINGSINVLGLVTTGLMHMVFNNPDGGSLYSFTELAKKVNRYAIKPINKVP